MLILGEKDLGPNVHASMLKWVFPHFVIFAYREEVMEGLPVVLGWGHFVMGVLELVIYLYAVFLYGSGKTKERSVAGAH